MGNALPFSDGETFDPYMAPLIDEIRRMAAESPKGNAPDKLDVGYFDVYGRLSDMAAAISANYTAAARVPAAARLK